MTVMQTMPTRLGEDELGLGHGQGVHQVALTPQQIFIKALDRADKTEHRNGEDDREIEDHQNDFEPPEIRIVGPCIFLPERNAQHHAQQRQRQIQPEVQAFGGLELIFQQLLQHLNTSRKYASTLLPSVSRMSSTARWAKILPSFRNTASSSTGSMSSMRWVEMTTVASLL